MLTFQEYLIEVIRIEKGKEPTPLPRPKKTRKPTMGERIRAGVVAAGMAAPSVSGLVQGTEINPTTVPALSGINFEGLHAHELTSQKEEENDK